MYIRKMVVENFRVLKSVKIDFNENINIIVGDNETGKTTLLEAINLVVSGHLNNRNIGYELSPYIFNNSIVNEYVSRIQAGEKVVPPSILIEVYFDDVEELAKFKGTNNTLHENCPGLRLQIIFDEDFDEDYSVFLNTPNEVHTIPIEFYKIQWLSFANNILTSRIAPLTISFIDNTLIKPSSNADRYLSKIINSVLERKQKVDISLLYRKLKDLFLDIDGVKQINAFLDEKKGDITDKTLSVSMDVSSHSSWESSLIPHLDGIPLYYAGQGEQSCVNIKLAMESSTDAHIFLVEEPENHLSFPNMNKLINKIKERGNNKQVFISTHSSFVLNKLGINNILMFKNNRGITLNELSEDTRDFFIKLPGHDTLRMILGSRTILVEGPSDELIIQRAYSDQYKNIPLEDGIDIISVRALAFKRFLEIAHLLKLIVSVVTDNDGDIEQVKEKYIEFEADENINICVSEEIDYPSLEPQLLHHNSLDIFNQIFGTSYKNDSDLLHYMKVNKTDCALGIFNSPISINYPKYIKDAIQQ